MSWNILLLHSTKCLCLAKNIPLLLNISHVGFIHSYQHPVLPYIGITGRRRHGLGSASYCWAVVTIIRAYSNNRCPSHDGTLPQIELIECLLTQSMKCSITMGKSRNRGPRGRRLTLCNTILYRFDAACGLWDCLQPQNPRSGPRKCLTPRRRARQWYPFVIWSIHCCIERETFILMTTHPSLSSLFRLQNFNSAMTGPVNWIQCPATVWSLGCEILPPHTT